MSAYNLPLEPSSEQQVEEQLLAFVDAIPTLAWMARPDGYIFWYNRRWYDYTGTTPKQMEGWGWQSVHDSSYLPQVMDRWTAAIRSGEPFEMVFPLRGADGVFRSFLTRIVPVRDDTGEIVRWFGTNTDVDELHRARLRLATSEKRFRAAAEAVGDIVWTNNAAGEMEGPQPDWQEFTGQTESQVQGFGWAKALHPDDVQPTIENWLECVAGRRNFVWEHRVRRADGTYRLCSVRAVPIIDNDGTLQEWVGVHTDVTEERERESELRKQGQLLDVAQSAARAGFWRLVESSGVIEWSSGSYDIFGMEPGSKVTMQDFWERVHPDDRGGVREAFATAERTGDYYAQYRIKRSSGETRWLASRARRFDESVEGPYFMGINLDITAEKVRERELRDQAELIDFAQSAANAGAFRWQLKTGKKTVSQNTYRMFAVEPRDVISVRELHRNVVPQDMPKIQEAIQRAQTTGEYYAEFRLQKPEGGIRWIAAKARLFGKDTADPYLLGLNFDITEKKLAEDTLLKTEKIAAVGRLASSISHEINNPLEAVTNFLYLAQVSQDREKVHEYVEGAQRELQRVTDIVTQTLRFHRQSSRPRQTRLSELIASVLTLHQPKLAKAKVEVHASYRKDEPVLCYEGEIRQVFANLIGNAIDAMPNGGRLEIRIAGALPVLGPPGMRVTVADTGGGMSHTTLARLFEPFYTTKGATGTGLGLWVSSEIVRKHNGMIRVRSSQRAGQTGTVFQVTLPFQATL